MNVPTHATLLLRESLDESRYFESLLARARLLALCDDALLRDLDRQMKALLLRRCKMFIGGQSGSIRAEVAESILQSTLFTLNLFLKSVEPIEALAALQNKSLEACYLLGRKRADAMLCAAELFYQSELPKPLPDNELLTSTFRDGLQSFFKLYNPEYGAHEIHITADYPVLFYPQKLQGIEFIRSYLDNFIFENRFLRLLDPSFVHERLTTYALRHQTTARALCDNLFLILLACGLRERSIPFERCSQSLQSYIQRAMDESATDIRRIQSVIYGI